MLYLRGDLNPADYMSRHLQGTSHCDLIADSAEQYVNLVLTQARPKALSRDDIIQATSQDATLQEVMCHLKWPVGQPEASGGSRSKYPQNLCQCPG